MMNDDVFEDNWVRNGLTSNMETIGIHGPFIVEAAQFGMTISFRLDSRIFTTVLKNSCIGTRHPP